SASSGPRAAGGDATERCRRLVRALTGEGSAVRRRAALLVVLVVGTALVACRAPDGGPDRPGPPHHGGGHALGTGNGYVDRHHWRAAQDGYLAFATEELTPTSPTNVLAHLTRA